MHAFVMNCTPEDIMAGGEQSTLPNQHARVAVT